MTKQMRYAIVIAFGVLVGTVGLSLSGHSDRRPFRSKVLAIPATTTTSIGLIPPASVAVVCTTPDGYPVKTDLLTASRIGCGP